MGCSPIPKVHFPIDITPIYILCCFQKISICTYIKINQPPIICQVGTYMQTVGGDHFTPVSHFVKNKEKMSIKYIFIYVCFPLALGLFINDFSTFWGFFYLLSSGNLRSPLLLYRLIQQRHPLADPPSPLVSGVIYEWSLFLILYLL